MKKLFCTLSTSLFVLLLALIVLNSCKFASSSLPELYISKEPIKLEYKYGELLDLSGIEVRARCYDFFYNYYDEIVTGWESNPADLTPLLSSGKTTITISFNGKTTSFDITVKEKPDENGINADPFFWGTWVRMDKGNECEVLETTVSLGDDDYEVTDSDENSLTVDTLGVFSRQSDSVIVCDNIPYFRNGGTNLEYSLSLVGFSSQLSRAVGTGIQGIKGRAISSKFKRFESYAESDFDGKIKFTAPTANDPQTVTITYGGSNIVIPGLIITNSGDKMGTVALVGENDYNLKITGIISEEQKDGGYIYGNNAKTYNMVLSITNISTNKCNSSICTIEPDPKEASRLSLVLSEVDKNLDAYPISTMLGGTTIPIYITISFGEMTEPFVDTGIRITLRNRTANELKEWTDYVPLRFYKGRIPITVAAKSPEDNDRAALNGFVIYPDGNSQFFSVNNNTSKTLFVPTFGVDIQYKMVFSGATVTSTLSDSTEMFYSVAPCSRNKKDIDLTIPDWEKIDSYMNYGGDNHSEETAYSAEEGFIAYLYESEIDYYTISADSNEFYLPGTY